MDKIFAIIMTIFMIIMLTVTLYVIDNKQNIVENKKTFIMVPPNDNNNASESNLIKEYDYRKTFDPFEQPARRVARHEIHPSYLKSMIDYPTRGYADSFTQFGLLVKDNGDKGKNDGHDENKILRLFSRQEFPGSNRYEYYTMINSGLDKIKIPLNIKRQELYDGDNVVVKELQTTYRVNLFKYDEPKYYPEIF